MCLDLHPVPEHKGRQGLFSSSVRRSLGPLPEGLGILSTVVRCVWLNDRQVKVGRRIERSIIINRKKRVNDLQFFTVKYRVPWLRIVPTRWTGCSVSTLYRLCPQSGSDESLRHQNWWGKDSFFVFCLPFTLVKTVDDLWNVTRNRCNWEN